MLNRWKKLLRDESGMGMIQAMLIASLVAGLALYFSSRTIWFKTQMSKLNKKGQIVDDRRILLFDLANRPLPTPTP